MPRVYQSPVKVTTRKAPLEIPHPHPPYQAMHDAEEGRRTAAEEARHTAAQADTPRQTKADTPGDTHTPLDTENPAEIQAAPDNAALHTPAPDNAAHAGTVSGPLSGMDPSVTSIPPQHQR